MGREIEHDQVIDRLIDLQARLRGDEPARPTGAPSQASPTWAAAETWAAGPRRRRPRDRSADPVTVTHDDVEVMAGPKPQPHPEVEPRPAVRAESARRDADRPPRLATILERVDELRADLARVVSSLDASVEQLAADRQHRAEATPEEPHPRPRSRD